MAKNNKKSGIKLQAGAGPLFSTIYMALIAAGAAMIYFLGFPFVSKQNYYMIICGVILILIALLFLTVGKVPDTVFSILAGCLLISIGILHPAVLLLALCGVYLIFDKILILTGHEDVAEKIGGKINGFLRKVFTHTLKVNPEDMSQDARNKSMGIRKVKDLSEQNKKQKDEKTPAVAATMEAQSTEGVSDTMAPDNIAAATPVTEPDPASSEAMVRPAPGQFITNFVAGFIFTVGGLMFTLSSFVFLSFSNSISDQLPFLLSGGIILMIGIWQLIKGFKTFAKSSRKE